MQISADRTMTLLSLREPLDSYHERTAGTHGYLYILVRPVGPPDDVVEAKSIATGRSVTLLKPFYDEAEIAGAEENTRLQG